MPSNNTIAINKGEAVLLLTTPYDTNSEWHQIRQRIQGELEQLRKIEAEEEDGEIEEYSPGKLQYPLSPVPTLTEDLGNKSDWTELGEFEAVCRRHQNKKGKQAQRQVRCQRNFSNLPTRSTQKGSAAGIKGQVAVSRANTLGPHSH
jgi:hypothetical protein